MSWGAAVPALAGEALAIGPAIDVEGGVWNVRVPIVRGASVAVELASGACVALGELSEQGPENALAAPGGVDHDIAAALLRLAVAEVRVDAHPAGPWVLDSALAAIGLVASLGLDRNASAADLARLADRRVAAGLAWLLRHDAALLARGGYDLRDDLLADLSPLRDWLGEGPEAASYDRWRALWRAELVREAGVFVPMPTAEVVMLPAGSLKIALPRAIFASGLVDAGARLELRAAADGGSIAELALRAEVRLAYDDARSTWERARSPEATARERQDCQRALRILGDSVRWATEMRPWGLRVGPGGPELPHVWVHLLDRVTGTVLRAAQMVPGHDGVLRAVLSPVGTEFAVLAATVQMDVAEPRRILGDSAVARDDQRVEAAIPLLELARQLPGLPERDALVRAAELLLRADGGPVATSALAAVRVQQPAPREPVVEDAVAAWAQDTVGMSLLRFVDEQRHAIAEKDVEAQAVAARSAALADDAVAGPLDADAVMDAIRDLAVYRLDQLRI